MSFLPQVSSSGNRKVKGSESHSFKSSLAARVVEVDPSGHFFVQGGRTVSIEGKEQSVAVSGWVNPADLNKKREIAFTKIADSRIVFKSFLQPGDPILTEEDIDVFAGLPAPTAVSDTTGASEASSEVTAATTKPAADIKAGQLGEEKKRELLLLYINRLVDLIFR